MAPIAPSSKPSVSRERARRQRVAPRASRVKTSRRRLTPRASRRFATLATPMSRMQPTAAEEAEERQPVAADERLSERGKLHGGCGCAVRMGRGDAPSDGRELEAGLFDRDARLQSSEDRVPRAAAIGSTHLRHRPTAPVAKRKPEARAGREVEGRRHHADDRERTAAKRIHVERLADDRRIAPETRLPEAVADDDRAPAARSVIVPVQRSSERRRDAHDGKESRRRVRALNTFAAVAAGHVEGECFPVPVGQHTERVEGCRLRFPVDEVRGRHAHARVGRARIGLPHRYEPVLRWKGQRPESDGPDGAECGGGRANGERECEDDQRRKTRRALETTPGIVQVHRAVALQVLRQ